MSGPRVLFITSTRLGDAVLSSGLLGHLVDSVPDARFTVACGPLPAPLFQAVPRLERLVVLRKRRRAGHWWAFWRACVGRPWSMVVDLRNTLVSRALVRRRLAVLPRSRPDRHRVVQIAATLGLAEAPPAPRVWLTEADRVQAAQLVPDGGPVLAIGPTANWPGKTWPIDRFIALARAVCADHPGLRVAVIAAAAERPGAAPLLDALPASRVLDLIGCGDPRRAAACLARCSTFVGNDSGLMHLAAAAGCATLGLFGPSRTTHYAPWGRRSQFVTTELSYDQLVSLPDFTWQTTRSFMTTLSVDRTLAALTALL